MPAQSVAADYIEKITEYEFRIAVVLYRQYVVFLDSAVEGSLADSENVLDFRLAYAVFPFLVCERATSVLVKFVLCRHIALV